MDLKLRRRAIYTGMRPYFEDKALLDAMRLWQEKYSNTPKFAFTEFLSICCQTKELRLQRSNILSSILKAMNLPEQELLADPFDEFSSELAIAPTATAISADNTSKAFMAFFTVLFSKLSEKEALTIRASLIKSCAKLNMDTRRKVALQEWLDKKIAQLDYRYELAEIRMVINHAYVAMCEYFGPVKSDQVLAQAIKGTEATADALDVNLHDFL